MNVSLAMTAALYGATVVNHIEVTGLTKDANGVWHGTATHDGTPAKVWLDYKGNVGTE